MLESVLDDYLSIVKVITFLPKVMGGGNIPMNIYYVGSIPVSDELYHHGILGQKWGIRRFQNPDGTLTPAGKKRYYGISESTDTGGSGGTSRAHYRVGGVGSKDNNTKGMKIERYQKDDGSFTEEGEKRYRQFEDDNVVSYDKRGNRVFDSDKYEKGYEARVSSLGDKFNTVNEQWVKLVDDVYSDNLTNFTKKNREIIEKGNEIFNRLSERSFELMKKVRAEEAEKRKPSALRQVFESDQAVINRNREITKATNERLKNNDEYTRIQKEIGEISRKLDKARGSEKTITMNKILNQLPEKDRQAAYELMRYYWWDYD